jgi:hypothetical protein
MAEAFKNAYLDVTSTNTAIYTNSSGGEAIVIALRATNINTSTDTITADVVDGTSGNSRIAFDMTVPVGGSVELAGNSKIVLENGDSIELTGGQSSGYIEAFASILEIT